ncbi:MAG: nucleotidyltransferase domain-containing protein [Candidatus Micrarchaeota archaeon]
MLEKYALIRAIRAISGKPGIKYSVRGFAKESKLSPGTASSSLNYMEKNGLVSKEIIGRSHLYKANLESFLLRHWKILFNLEEIERSGIVEKLIGKIPNIQSILLYGSCARGTNDEKSDFDILVIAQKEAKIDPQIGKTLPREPNISAMSMAAWHQKSSLERVYYENVIYESIVLYGNRPVVL